MNKKVLTLCAGMLLAGGLLSSVNADDWTTSIYVANSGKYHTIERTSSFDGTNWDRVGGYYLTVDETTGEPIFAPTAMQKDENAYWTVVTRNDGRRTEYQLINAKGVVFKYLPAGATEPVEWFLLDSRTSTSGDFSNALFYYDNANQFHYLTDDGNRRADGTYLFTETAAGVTTDADGFDNVEIDDVLISAADLNAELQNGFQLQFGKTVDGEYEEFTDWATDDNGNSNVFAGTLYAEAIGTTGTYYLRKGQNGDYIVLTDELWGGTRSDLNGTDNYKGYRFDLYNAHDFQQEIVNNNLEKNAIFQIYKSHDFGPAYADSLIVTMPGVLVGDIMTTDTKVRVFVADVNNQSWLTIAGYAQADDRLDPNKKDAKEAPYIRLGQSNIVDFKDFAGKVWNITTTINNSKRALSPDVNYIGELDDFSSEFDPISEILLTAPEGEWLPYYTNAENYGFVNRESGVQWNIAYRYNGEYWVIRNAGTNRYTVWNSKYATGTQNLDEMNNIYDLGGNLWEWTLELAGNATRVVRGGNFKYKASASNRAGVYTNGYNSATGSRLALYIK